MIALKNKKIGLVLSGGGAKGAYQIGMFRALEELKLAQQITVMSGCSIGAFAEVVYATSGTDAMRDFLHQFKFFLEQKSPDPQAMAQAKELVAQGKVTLEEFCTDERFSMYNTADFAEYLQRLLPDGAIDGQQRKLHVCAYSLERQRPEYFDLGGLSDDERRAVVLASASLPFVFPPVSLFGGHYLDGGVIPAICTQNPQRADKIPLKPLIHADVDFILVNFLIARDKVDSSGLAPGTDYLELRPSTPLEDYPGSGTLDFSPQKLQSHEEKGYRDTLRLFEENCVL